MFQFLVAMVSVLLCMVPAHPLDTDDVQDPDHYLNSFLIKVDTADAAKLVARDLGFQILNEISELKMYHLYHPQVSSRSRRSADHYVDKLRSHPMVEFAEQQITLRRVKRMHHVSHDKQNEFRIREIKDPSLFYRVPMDTIIETRGKKKLMFNDRFYDDEWYLRNYGQTGGQEDIDLNVVEAWDKGFTGRGFVISILDDGIDHKHPDLQRNYDPEASADLNDEDDIFNDPTPDTSNPGNSHGTRCAGEIAAEANNGICGVGIAYNAKVGGIRILDGRVTDRLEAVALLYHNQHSDIYSASWGPHDNGQTMEAPKKACSEALKKGAEVGRGGKGSIFVWATGNGGGFNDSCAADGYVSSIYSISCGSLSDHGEIPFYMEQCCSTMTVLPTGGEATREEERIDGKYKIKVVTTDLDGGCTENFEGTSSAAPLGAGAMAIVLQADPTLTWRDVQHIVAMGSRIPQVDDSMVINGAGFHVSMKFGFGMMDVGKMVELAQQGVHVPEQHTCQTKENRVNREVPNDGCIRIPFDFDGCQNDPERHISNMEHVRVHIKLSTHRRGNTVIFLTSPAGTESQLLPRRDRDTSSEGIDFTFMTVHKWMESPHGQWQLTVCDQPDYDSTVSDDAVLQSWSMTVYGFYNVKAEPTVKSYKPSIDTQKKWIQDELEESKRLVIKRDESGLDEEETPGPGSSDTVIDDILSMLDDYSSRREFNDNWKDTIAVKKSSFVSGAKPFTHKRGYNTHAYKNYGEVNVSKKELNTKTDVDTNLDEIVREISQVLDEIDEIDSIRKSSYLDSYFQSNRERDHKRRVNDLDKKLLDILEK